VGKAELCYGQIPIMGGKKRRKGGDSAAAFAGEANGIDRGERARTRGRARFGFMWPVLC
jgi:hypothetical protein